MAKRSLSDQLDKAVESIMTKTPAPPERLHPRLTDLLEIAAELRDLPSDEFRTRLRADLVEAAVRPMPSVATATSPMHSAARAALISHDVGRALRDLPEMSMRFLGTMDQYTIGVSRFSTTSHWERHPAGDEMLHILEGEVDITTLTNDGPVSATAGAGSLFICRRGLWHRLSPRSPSSLLFATPGEGTESSEAENPRRERPGPISTPPASTGGRPQPAESGRDLRAALRDLPRLEIGPNTKGDEAALAVRDLATFDQRRVGVICFSGQTPWERHPDGDELLHVLEGEVDVTVLTDGAPVHATVPAGSIFVCPRGLWHRQVPRPSVTELFATPANTTQISWAEDPRP